MNARRDSSDEPVAGSTGGRVLLVGAVVFAVAATALLVLSDELRWLRLGIVAALWAALVGAFLAAKYRRQLSDQQEVAADRQEIYELELEREIAARREYELEVAAEAKRQAEEDSRDDIAALRGELQTLRQTLEGLLGGEFLVERYALRAESTRMRSLGEDRALAARHDLKRLPAARPRDDIIVPPVVREAETELIERIHEVHHKPRHEPQPYRREPRVESRPPSLPRRAERPARTEWPTPEPVKPVQPAVARRHERWAEHPAEVSDRWFVPDGGGQPAPPAPRRPVTPPPPPRPAHVDPPPRRAAPAWDDNERSWESGGHARHEATPPSVERHGYDPSVPFGGKSEQTSWLAQYNKPQDPEPTYSSRAFVPPIRVEPPSPPDPVLTDRPSRRGIDYLANVDDEPSGRRHRAEPAEPEPGGGRRRRAEGAPPWQETVGRGGHARAEEPTGSHAAGRSVNELLARHGLDTSPRRRRRRED